MVKFVAALATALIAGWLVAGSASSAGARECHRCGPLPTTIHVHIVHPEKFLTHYHDRSVTQRVARDHRIVNVTQVQPIIHVHEVTRVHHRTVYFVKDTYQSRTEHLRPLMYVSSSVRNYYSGGCGCAP